MITKVVLGLRFKDELDLVFEVVKQFSMLEEKNKWMKGRETYDEGKFLVHLMREGYIELVEA